MSQSGRRKRGRGRPSRRSSGKVDYHSKLATFDKEEDPATFWQRSNARLGIDEGGSGSRGRSPVEHPCAVCGLFVGLERMPKERHDVICATCRGALGSMYDDEDQLAADSYVKERKSKQRGLLDGLPEMSEEDLAAVDSIKALFDNQSSGRSGNRRRSSHSKGKRRRSTSRSRGQNSNGSDSGSKSSGRGGRRRRRSGRRGGGQNQSQSAPTSEKNATPTEAKSE